MWQPRDRSTLVLSQQAPTPFGSVTARWARLRFLVTGALAGREQRGGAYNHAVAAPPVLGVQVRPVTAANYEAELDAIGSLLASYPFVAIDTEYPGTVHRPPPGRSAAQLAPPEQYALVKANVDELTVVQLGLTLCDEYGNIPVALDGGGRPLEVAWEVTFSDFDARRDSHAPESVEFLRSSGIDFDWSRARRGLRGVRGQARRRPVVGSGAAAGWRADVGGVRRRVRLRVPGEDARRWAAAAGDLARVRNAGEGPPRRATVRRQVHGGALRARRPVRGPQAPGRQPLRAADELPGAAGGVPCWPEEPQHLPHLHGDEEAHPVP